MRQFGLTVENIISLLSEEVLSNRNFAALKLAIELLALKPASKTDITTDGQPLLNYDEVQKRLADKIARLAAGKGKA